MTKRKLILHQRKVTEKYHQLEGIQTQRSNNPDCYRCLQKQMQGLDEEADKIRWILEGDGYEL